MHACLSLTGNFVFHFHVFCGLPYIAIVWQVTTLTFFMIPSLVLCLCFLFWSCLLLHWSPPQSAIFRISHSASACDNTWMWY